MDLARPCWFSQSGGAPHEDRQGKASCSLLPENTATDIPLERNRTHYRDPKLRSPAGQSCELCMPQPCCTHWWLMIDVFPVTSAPLLRMGPSYMPNHFLSAAPVLRDQEAEDLNGMAVSVGWTLTASYQILIWNWCQSPWNLVAFGELFCVFICLGVSYTPWSFCLPWSPCLPTQNKMCVHDRWDGVEVGAEHQRPLDCGVSGSPCGSTDVFPSSNFFL